MPIIIGIVLGLACLVSGVGFWGYLPNGDLLAIFNEAIVRLSIETGQISQFWLTIWGCIFIASIATIILSGSYGFYGFDPSEDVTSMVASMGTGCGCIIIIGVGFGVGVVIGVITGISGVVGVIIGSSVVLGIGFSIGGLVAHWLDWAFFQPLYWEYDIAHYPERISMVIGYYIGTSASAFSTVVIVGIIWLLLRPFPTSQPVIQPTLTFSSTLTTRELTVVALQQSNETLIAEITGTSTQLTANAYNTAVQMTVNADNTATQIAQNIIETATEIALLSTEYALKQTQDALIALRQGTGVPTPPPISPTPYPTNTPSETPTLTATSKPMSPTPSVTSDANITLTANAQALASLEVQSTNTPELDEASQIIAGQSNISGGDILGALRDPIWGGIAGIIAICGLPLALAGLYFTIKESQNKP